MAGTLIPVLELSKGLGGQRHIRLSAHCTDAANYARLLVFRLLMWIRVSSFPRLTQFYEAMQTRNGILESQSSDVINYHSILISGGSRNSLWEGGVII